MDPPSLLRTRAVDFAKDPKHLGRYPILPLNLLVYSCSGPCILVLGIKYGLRQLDIGDPFYPAQRIQERPNIRLYNYCGGVFFPRPTKVRRSCNVVKRGER
jgi:hypothetical protein